MLFLNVWENDDLLKHFNFWSLFQIIISFIDFFQGMFYF